ncbi:transposase family protein [Kitasatospora indigofera]|uniref:transposase family protein n=1 Tax=Kitasatospora indigofera TaxID=67307 RepID=UPI00368F7BD9
MERLRILPDPRRRRGVRYPFVAALPVAALEVIVGAHSYAAICQWSTNAPQHAPGPPRCPGRGSVRRAGRTECRHGPADRRPGPPRRSGRPDRR